MLSIRNISRYKAASIHLVLSTAIAAAVLALMLALWYPPPLFRAMGGAQLILLIVGVDVAIGPLITLIIFDPRKKELVFDLTVVAALQVAALGYGVYAMHAGRPAFTVFTGEHFAVVAAAAIEPEELAKAHGDEFRRLSLTGPRLVAAELPADAEERSNIAFAALGGMGIENMPRYFVTYDEKREVVLAKAKALTDLALGTDDRERLDRYLIKTGRRAAELRCLPVKTKFAMLTALLDASSGNLVDILEITPTLAEH